MDGKLTLKPPPTRALSLLFSLLLSLSLSFRDGLFLAQHIQALDPRERLTLFGARVCRLSLEPRELMTRAALHVMMCLNRFCFPPVCRNAPHLVLKFLLRLLPHLLHSSLCFLRRAALARMVLLAAHMGCLDPILTLCCTRSYRSPLRLPMDPHQRVRL